MVGIGNRERGDDAVGPEVASRIARLGLPGLDVVVYAEPLALVEHLASHDDVVVVDATGPRGRPGTVDVLRVGTAPLHRPPPAFGSHGLGVADAVELARALDRLPERLTVVGVQGWTFDVGAGLSAEVEAALDEAVRAVLDVLSATS